jgi:hypothetical protein
LYLSELLFGLPEGFFLVGISDRFKFYKYKWWKKKAKKSTTKNYNSKQYTTVTHSTTEIAQSTKVNLSPETKTLYHYIYLVTGIFLIIWGLLKTIFFPGFILFALLGLYLVKKSR